MYVLFFNDEKSVCAQWLRGFNPPPLLVVQPLKKLFLGVSSLREAAKKESSSLKGWEIKEKRTFFVTFFSNVPFFQRPISSRGGRP